MGSLSVEEKACRGANLQAQLLHTRFRPSSLAL